MMAGNGADISPDGKVLGLRAYASQIFGGAQLMKDIGSRMEALASEAETTTIGDNSVDKYPARSPEQAGQALQKLSETFRPRFSPLLGRRSSVWLPQSVAQRRLTRRASSFDAGTLDYSTSEDEDEEDGEASSTAAQRNRSRLESDVSRASLSRKPASLPTLHPPDPKPQVSEVSGIEALRAKLSLQGVREAAEVGEGTGAPDRPSAAPDEETRFGSVSLDEIPFIDQNSSRPSSLHQKNSVQVHPRESADGGAVVVANTQALHRPEPPKEAEAVPVATEVFLPRSRRLTPVSLRRRLLEGLGTSVRQLIGYDHARHRRPDPANPKSMRSIAKKEQRHIRRERKATQTLAVVLMVFLVCWVPFFTCHLTNSICILAGGGECIDFVAFFFTTWLGYMNSFMNPIIYTLFNPEYRKAFRKILLCSR